MSDIETYPGDGAKIADSSAKFRDRDPRADPRPGDVVVSKLAEWIPNSDCDPIKVEAVVGNLVAYSEHSGHGELRWVKKSEWCATESYFIVGWEVIHRAD